MRVYFIIVFSLISTTFSTGAFAQKSADAFYVDSIVRKGSFTFIAKIITHTTGDLKVKYYDDRSDATILNPQQLLNFNVSAFMDRPPDYFQERSGFQKVRQVIILADKKGIRSYAPPDYYPSATQREDGAYIDKRMVKWKAKKNRSGKWTIKMFYPVRGELAKNQRMFLEIKPDKKAVLTVASSGMPTLFYDGFIK